MHRFFRPILYVLLVCFLTSVSAWAKTVVHHDNDSFHPSLPLAQVQKAVEQSPISAPTPDQHCDHSCHMASHLVGLFTPEINIPTTAKTNRISFRLLTSTRRREPDNPYRPPRIFPSV